MLEKKNGYCRFLIESLVLEKNFAELCNGSTTDSGSVCLGSSPGSATEKKDILSGVFFAPIPHSPQVLSPLIGGTINQQADSSSPGSATEKKDILSGVFFVPIPHSPQVLSPLIGGTINQQTDSSSPGSVTEKKDILSGVFFVPIPHSPQVLSPPQKKGSISLICSSVSYRHLRNCFERSLRA